MSDSNYTTLGPPLAQCFMCGTCCYGHAVELMDDDETARIERHGATMGIEMPVVDGELRFEKGGCVFLNEKRLCGIHDRFGFEEKPLRCQAWPLKLVRTEGEIRLGVDPGCSSTYRHFNGTETLEPPARMVVRLGAVGPQERGMELALIRETLKPNASVLGLAHLLAGDRDPGHVTELPGGMAARMLTRFQATRFRQLLAKEEFGWGIRSPVEHLLVGFDTWDVENPPKFELSPELQAYALDTFRRKLFLREAPVEPKVIGDALLTLMGIIICAWANPAPEVFGPALAGWTRLLRFKAFWLRLSPEPGILQWIGTGNYTGPLRPDIVVGGPRDAP